MTSKNANQRFFLENIYHLSSIILEYGQYHYIWFHKRFYCCGDCHVPFLILTFAFKRGFKIDLDRNIFAKFQHPKNWLAHKTTAKVCDL